MEIAEPQGWKDFKIFAQTHNFQSRILYSINSPIKNLSMVIPFFMNLLCILVKKKKLTSVLSKLQEDMLWQNQEIIEEKEDVGSRSKNVCLTRVGKGNTRMLSVP